MEINIASGLEIYIVYIHVLLFEWLIVRELVTEEAYDFVILFFVESSNTKYWVRVEQ